MMTSESWQLRCAELKQRGAYLYQSKLWADCTFQLDDVTIKAHKLIMAMASPVFSKMLYGSFVKFPMPIYDVRPEVFDVLLEYIYSDNLNIKTSKDACDLYYAAKKWRLPYVAKCCVKYLNDHMSPDHVCHVYRVACESGDSTLQATCEKIFSSRTKEVLKNNSFYDIDISTVKKLFSIDPLNINNELDLFEAVVQYANFHEQNTKTRNVLRRTNEDSIVTERPSPPKKARSDFADDQEPNDDCNLEESAANRSDGSYEHMQSEVTETGDKQKYRELTNSIRFLTLTPQEFAECSALPSLLTESEMFALSMNVSSKETMYPMPKGFSTSMVPRTQATKDDRTRLAAIFRSIIHNFKSMQKYESMPFYLRNLAWTLMVIVHSNYYVLGVTCFFEIGVPEWLKNTKVKVKFSTHKPVPRYLHKIVLRVNESNPEYGAWVTKVKREDLLNPDYGFVDDFNTVTYKLYINTVPRPNDSPDAEELASNPTSIADSPNLVLRVPKAQKNESVTISSQSVKNTLAPASTTSANQKSQPDCNTKSRATVSSQPKASPNVTQSTRPGANETQSLSRPGANETQTQSRPCPNATQSQSRPGPNATQSQSRPCPNATQSQSRPCPNATQSQSRPCPNATQSQSRPCPNAAQSQSRPCPNAAQSQSRPCLNTTQSQSRPCPNVAQSQSRPCLNATQSQSRPCPNATQSQSRPCVNESQPQSRPCANVIQSQSKPCGTQSQTIPNSSSQITPDATQTQSQPCPSLSQSRQYPNATPSLTKTGPNVTQSQTKPFPKNTTQSVIRPLEAIAQYQTNPSPTVSAQSRPAPSVIAVPQSRPSPSVTDVQQSRPSPSVTDVPQSRPSPSVTDVPQSRPSPSVTDVPQSRPSPSVTDVPQSRPSPSVTDVPQSRSSPSVTDVLQCGPLPSGAVVPQSRPFPSATDVPQSRLFPSVAAVPQSRPSPTAALQQSRTSPTVTAVQHSLLSPNMTALRQSRPSPTVTALQLSRPSPTMTAIQQSRPPSNMTVMHQSRPSPAMTAIHQSRPAPTMTALQQSRPSPTMTALQQSRPSPTMTALQQYRPSPTVTALQQSRPSPTMTALQQSRPSPTMTALQQSRPSPTMTALQQSRPSPTMTALQQSRPSPTMTALQQSRPSPTMTALQQSRPSPTITALQHSLPSSTMTALQQSAPSPSMTAMQQYRQSSTVTALGSNTPPPSLEPSSTTVDTPVSESSALATGLLLSESHLSSVINTSPSLKRPWTVPVDFITVDPPPIVPISEELLDLSQDTITISRPSLPEIAKQTSNPLHAVTLPWPTKRTRTVSDTKVSFRPDSEFDGTMMDENEDTKTVNAPSQFYQPKSLQAILFKELETFAQPQFIKDLPSPETSPLTSTTPKYSPAIAQNPPSLPAQPILAQPLRLNTPPPSLGALSTTLDIPLSESAPVDTSLLLSDSHSTSIVNTTPSLKRTWTGPFDFITVDPPPIVPISEELLDMSQDTITISRPSLPETAKQTSNPLHAVTLPWPTKRTRTVSDTKVLFSDSEFDGTVKDEIEETETVNAPARVFQPKSLHAIIFAELGTMTQKHSSESTENENNKPKVVENERSTSVQPKKLEYLALCQLNTSIREVDEIKEKSITIVSIRPGSEYDGSMKDDNKDTETVKSILFQPNSLQEIVFAELVTLAQKVLAECTENVNDKPKVVENERSILIQPKPLKDLALYELSTLICEADLDALNESTNMTEVKEKSELDKSSNFEPKSLKEIAFSKLKVALH